MLDTASHDLLNAVPLPMVVISATQVLHAANMAAMATFPDIAVGRNYALSFRQPAIVAAVDRAQHENTPVQTINFARGEAGFSDRIFRAHVTRVATDVVIAFEDLSEQEQVGQMRRDFVANVSHELRTPLTALMGFIETLRGAAKDDANARDRFLAIMDREASRMNRLVRDLLSLSRVESEERQRPAGTVDLASLLQFGVTTLRPMAVTNGVTLALHLPQDPVTVPGDSDQLTQVMHNLIENAVKYGGPDKTVTVTLDLATSDPALRGPTACITVQDQGPGIAAVHLPRLTERFYRIDTHRSREQGGTGLGLAIVKHIINRHRGRLLIASTPGQGSQFTILLPRG